MSRWIFASATSGSHGRNTLARLARCATAAGALALAAGLVGVMGWSAGCSASSQLTGDSLADVKSPKFRTEVREMALDILWEETEKDPAARRSARNALKELVWNSAETPTELRIRIMEKLLSDKDEAGLADSRTMARLMIPREPSRTMMVYLGSVISARRWTDFTGPLVRSFARPMPLVPDKERSERSALVALYPDRTVEATVYDVFVHPPAMDEIPEVNVVERLRTEAWDLLGRLDPSGSFRIRVLAETSVPADDAVMMAIQRSAREARAIPISGGEIPWLTSLLSPDKPGNAAWWSEVTAVSSSLGEEQQRGLCLRHLEPLRWAKSHKPEWLTASRESLLAELARRLEDRRTHRRAADSQANRKPVRQDLDTWRDKLVYGDVLAILVIDDAVREAKAIKTFFQQQMTDYQDKTTEYGGIIDFSDTSTATERTWSGEERAGPSGWRVRLFPPRASQRLADDQFIASNDMMSSADRSLAIYHFHTQRFRNDDFAGPSDGDTDFATHSGRSCIVLTSVREGTLNVDYYQPGGAPSGPILDLGDIEKP